MLALGVVVPFSGWLGDRFGFKRLYIASLSVFVAGSLFCSLSWSLNSLIVARVIQAIGGGMIMPTTMAMVFRMVPGPSTAAPWGSSESPSSWPRPSAPLWAATWWSMSTGGGSLRSTSPSEPSGSCCPSSFCPSSSPSTRGGWTSREASPPPERLFCLLLALTKGADWGWGAEQTVLLFVVSFFLFVLFIYLELTSENPLLDLSVFKFRSFTMANLMVIVTNIVMFSALFFLPLFLQSFRGLGAMQTGLLMMPGALVSGLMMPVVGRLFDRIGPRILALTGIVLLMFISWLFHYLNLATATLTIIAWTMLRGLVMPLANMPAQTAAMVDIPTQLVGRASAITNIIGRVSSSFGIAVLTSILNTRQVLHWQWLAWTVNPANPAAVRALSNASAMMGGGTRGLGMALAFLNGMAMKTAFVDAIDDVFLITTALTAIAIVPAFFLKRGKAGTPRGAAMAE